MDQPELLSSAIHSDRYTAAGTVRSDVEHEAIRWLAGRRRAKGRRR
jgi:hypothetical protein